MGKLKARLLSYAAAFALSATPGCIHMLPKYSMAPKPSKIKAMKTEERKPIGTFAFNIQNEEDFKPFEPILEEITGQRVVSEVEIMELPFLFRFYSKNGGAYYCHEISPFFFPLALPSYLLTGCTGVTEHIVIGSKTTFLESHKPQEDRLLLWVHEQGHHFDLRTRPGRWNSLVDETEAMALMFYFSEHIANEYNKEAGLRLLRTLFSLSSEYDLKNSLHGNAVRSCYIILSDKSHDSFGDVWYFVHTHSHSEVHEAINRNSARFDEGYEEAKRIFFDLGGTEEMLK